MALDFMLSVSRLGGGGRWGVAQACNCRSILDAIATLIHAQRTDLAIIVIENELNSQT